MSTWIMIGAGAVIAFCTVGLITCLREVTVNRSTQLLEMHDPSILGIMASQLHLWPGEWPHTVPTTLGDGTAFIVTKRVVHSSDLLWVDYTQRTGMTLRVFNDLPV